jgi:uncharacterized protein (DUF433 family)
MGHESSETHGAATVQRSFRLKPRTLELLGERAGETAESRNALAERLLEEGVRTDRHPLISFRQGASGRRRPALGGTRLDVTQVVTTVRGEGGDIAAAAEYLSVPERLVQAAVNYYADFTEEIDALQTGEQAHADAERRRWERAQQVLG